MRRVHTSALCLFGVALTAMLTNPALQHLRADAAQAPSDAWASTGNLATARAGAASALLHDGRVLVTGGVNPAGMSASVERYSPISGSYLAMPPMPTPRANHTATLLLDGRVLVAGGITTGGEATSSAEVFDPATGAWTPTAPMFVARSGHTATALDDGRVIITGGDDGSSSIDSIEVFDPSMNLFLVSTGRLTSPRAGHAVAQLYDGRLLVTGGFDGTSALVTTDIYNPFLDSVSTGPTLGTGRAGHSATRLLDGRVLVAGGAGPGGALASAEVFDPATGSFVPTGNAMVAARQRHQALLLPHNNQVLIVGGTAGPMGAAVTTAEVFVAWQGTGGRFFETNAPADARAWATGTALSFLEDDTIRSGPTDGLLLLAGGSPRADAANPFASSELYGFATVTTDQADYAPGTTVTITGSGWVPGETVLLTLIESPPRDQHALQPVTADSSGRIVSTEFVPDENDLDVRFYLTATIVGTFTGWAAKTLSTA